MERYKANSFTKVRKGASAWSSSTSLSLGEGWGEVWFYNLSNPTLYSPFTGLLSQNSSKSSNPAAS